MQVPGVVAVTSRQEHAPPRLSEEALGNTTNGDRVSVLYSVRAELPRVGCLLRMLWRRAGPRKVAVQALPR